MEDNASTKSDYGWLIITFMEYLLCTLDTYALLKSEYYTHIHIIILFLYLYKYIHARTHI